MAEGFDTYPEVGSSSIAPLPQTGFNRDITSTPEYKAFSHNVGKGIGGEYSYPKSRRTMRREAEFRKYQSQQLEDQYRMQQMADAQRRLALDELQYQRGIENDRLSREKALQDEQDAAEVRNQAMRFYDGLKTIDFQNDPEAIAKMDALSNQYPRSVEWDGVLETATRKQNIASTYGMVRSNEQMRQQRDRVNTSITKYISAGGDPTLVMSKEEADPTTGERFYNIDPAKLDEETAKIEGAKVKEQKAKEAKQPQVEAEKSAASSARSLINDFEKESARSAADIARLTKLVQGGDKKSQALLDAKMAEKAVYDSKIEELRAGLGGGAMPPTAQPQTSGQRPSLGDIFGGR